jgi:5-methylcytosine-specific restriction endonuclease McrA
VYRRYVADGRVTFCRKCVSEKLVNAQCEACRDSYSRGYRERTKERRTAYKAAFWAANKDRLSAANRAHYWANAEARKAKNREYHRTEREACNIRQGRRRALVEGAAGSHTAAEWLAVKAKHGNKCAQCGARGCLTKDHIIPYAKGGTNFAYNLQPLCGSCNSAKNARLEAGAQHSLFDRV